MSSSLSLSGYKLTFNSEFAAMSNSDFGLPGTPGITWETEVFYEETLEWRPGDGQPDPAWSTRLLVQFAGRRPR